MFKAVLNFYTVRLFPKQQTNSTGVKGTNTWENQTIKVHTFNKWVTFIL